jgi:hypothetical protein
MNKLVFKTYDIEKPLSILWGKRKAKDLGTKIAKQQCHPGALESGVTGEKHTSTVPKISVNHHTFHFAVPLAQNSSSKVRSRRVSIGCQNPW